MEIHFGSIGKYRTLYLRFIYQEMKSCGENEVGVHFRTVYNDNNVFIFSFLCLWHDFG